MAEQIIWTSPDGSTRDLTDDGAGYRVLGDGTSGLRSVAYDITASRYAGIDGSTVGSISAVPNEPTLGLLVRAVDEDDLRRKIRGLVHAMRPKAGIGSLTVRNETGEARTLNCYCTDGLPGAESTDTILDGQWWRALLKFYAPDPWWTGAAQTVDFGLGPPTTFFPIFPLVLSASTVQGEFTVDLSDTDAETFPIWTITGPGSGVVLTNETTGLSLSLDAALTAGQSMTVDTRPQMRSVRRDDGVNLLPQLTPGTDPSLWPLVDGVNTVTAVLVGATSASRVAGWYQPRYSGI